MTTMQTAEALAKAIGSLPGHTAKVWEGGSQVRVYVRGPYSRKGDGGYAVVIDDAIDASELRGEVAIGLGRAGVLAANWASDISRVQLARVGA